ncbi:MocR-like pyridoxine biosynthesis transcription factor PdxR [Azospirillum picis]|uniref:GntR family transcriptional regulator/MocR family aminotransferase n=1 Tax=Azospirillum picis TaxID=488438 RepID=A0ABU0MT16_9PROT|nr:PLP-dependent aminotransferase family protein [Azospirillum picis]MBP2302861.1 GntR family transcriptional regulator/MocR family aminotransferase [Azospirillum picis]MDQ0536634.1 GntR family transcriptional regulator/MocR family aminotransferase [Azospirillum picis]
MSRPPRPVLSSLGPLSLDRDGAEPLHRQLYLALRQAVLDGRLRPGERLPPSRTLAADHGLSRNTVVTAYDTLLAEGYIAGRTGAGTFVASALPDAKPDGVQPRSEVRRGVGLSTRGRMLAGAPALARDRVGRPFALGTPDLDAFPFALWAQLLGRCWRQGGKSLAAEPDPLGHPPLRAEIAAYLRAVRAVRCEAEQVVIVSGAQQGLALMAQLLLDPGDAAWVEDPGWPGNRAALLGAGARLVPVPVDGEGIDVAAGMARGPDARLVLATPSHQFPLGVTMSLARRLGLLDWAAARDAWIVEDDYDSEFRYAGPPLAALQGLDGAGRVIYVGSFSKVMFPSLRLGYVVVPPDLVEPVRAARRHFDGGTSLVPQAALHRFLADGHFASHLRTMRALYAGKRSVILDAVGRAFAGDAKAEAGEAGMHVLLRLPPDCPDRLLSERAARVGLTVPALSSYSAPGAGAGNGLLLGFAAHQPEALCRAVEDLARLAAKGDASRHLP